MKCFSNAQIPPHLFWVPYSSDKEGQSFCSAGDDTLLLILLLSCDRSRSRDVVTNTLVTGRTDGSGLLMWV